MSFPWKSFEHWLQQFVGGNIPNKSIKFRQFCHIFALQYKNKAIEHTWTWPFTDEYRISHDVVIYSRWSTYHIYLWHPVTNYDFAVGYVTLPEAPRDISWVARTRSWPPFPRRMRLSCQQPQRSKPRANGTMVRKYMDDKHIANLAKISHMLHLWFIYYICLQFGPN